MSIKVLLTTVEAGGGHVAVMDSLYKSLSGHEPQIEVVTYQSAQQHYDNIYRVIARSPQLLEFLHYSSIKLVRWFKPLVTWPELAGAQKALAEQQPDIVVCTHPFQTLVFAELRSRLNRNFKIVTCICDYGDPKEYVEYAPPVDAYLVRDEATRQQALKYLPGRDDSVYIFGTVVKAMFETYGQRPVAELKDEFQTLLQEAGEEKAAQYDPAKPNVLVVGGSGWVRKSRTLIDKLAESGKYNLLVICGKDTPLREELCSQPGLFCFGFLEQEKLALLERYADAAVLATIAPATMYELLTINKYPLFVHRFHARQEAPHIPLLSEWKIGFYQPDDLKMMALLDDYLAQPAKYREYLENGAARCAEERQKASDNYKFILTIADAEPILVQQQSGKGLAAA